MSDEHDAVESTETNGNSPRINRRRFIQTVGTTAGISTLGLGGFSSAAAGESTDTDLHVTATSKLSDSEARSELSQLLSDQRVKSLNQGIQTVTAYDLHVESPLAVSVQTNDETVNQADPTVIILGYSSESDQNNAGGMLLSVIVDTTPNKETSTRQPLMAIGKTIEKPSNSASSVSTTSTKLAMKTMQVDQSGTVDVVDQKQLDPQPSTNADLIAQPSTNADLIGCGICIALVSQICDSATGTIGKRMCISACTPLLSGTIFGYAACVASCALLVDAINNYGCGAGAGVICKGTNIC